MKSPEIIIIALGCSVYGLVIAVLLTSQADFGLVSRRMSTATTRVCEANHE